MNIDVFVNSYLLLLLLLLLFYILCKLIVTRASGLYKMHCDSGHAVALCYKPEGRKFDSRWCHWNFSLT